MIFRLIRRIKSTKLIPIMSQSKQNLSSQSPKLFLQPLSDPIYQRKDIFPDLHLLDGPLQEYRYRSSFDWRKMRLIADTAPAWELRMKVWNFIKDSPHFTHSHETLPLDEQRRLATIRMYAVQNEQMFGPAEYFEHPELGIKYSTALCSFEPSVQVKLGIAFGMFPSVVMSLGSERVQDFVADNQTMESVGCFALTEIAHGSNTNGMKTTATYDNSTKSFIINTPNFEAAKCWIGNLGKNATDAVVYAQLYTADGKCHGLNAFVVPVRDRKTMLPFAGVIIGDLGEKVGLNGVDNGFVSFNNYKIPKDYLLSKTGDIDENGNFVTQFKDPKKRMGTAFAALSAGRVSICEIATSYGVDAITIAARYSACRKQFGPENSDIEFPVLEYQSNQYRVIPHLASIYAIKTFSNWIAKENSSMTIKGLTGGKVSVEAGMEIHAISSSGKAVCGWTVRDIIQDCREVCAGHGYLKCARLGDLRNSSDPNCTYEGENSVLIQQASNVLIAIRGKGWSAFEESSPLGTAAFLKDGDRILASKWNWNKVECAMKPENILTTFNWICAYLLEKTFARVKQLQQSGQSQFDTRNNSQVFNANALAIAYGHRQIFATFNNQVSRLQSSPERDVLLKLLSLYGANLLLTKYTGTLYEGGFVQAGSNPGDLWQSGILDLLPALKDEVIALVDAIAVPDHILNSPLGMSDGNMYKHLEAVMYQSPDTFTRPTWWQEMVHKDFLKAKM